ncbi:MAG: DUF2760 domain-containing protein [Candidatus Riflebacteria bacterium]|nr:DUF2760 domain-containing protein [Candidatus Riflebacteria bacterium]
MKKLTAILLLLLTLAFIGSVVYLNKDILGLESSGNNSSVPNFAESNTQGINPGGCIPSPNKNEAINQFSKRLKEYSVPIGFGAAYMVLTLILVLMTLSDKTKKQLHTDEEYNAKNEELTQVQTKLEESNKASEELKTQLEANKVDSEKINQLQLSLDEAKKEIEDNKTSLQNKTEEFDKLKSEAEAVSNKAENLEKDNKGIRREVDKLNSKLKASDSEKDELKSKIIELTKQIEAQEEEIKAAAANVKGGKEAIPPAAYQILYLLQKEGRLIDLLNEDISGIEDEDLGGAVRPVLEGCAKLLKDRLVVEPVLKEEEGSVVTVDEADPETIKLSGTVPESGPYKGELIHHGWRLKECNLPELVDGWKGNVIAPAEIEIN